MSKSTWWKWATMAGGIIAASCAAMAAESRWAAVEEEQSPAVAPGVGLYRGSKTCVSCHKDGPEKTDWVTAIGFIKLNEWTTWSTADKHSIAYRSLTEARGQKMAALLKTDVTDLKAGCIGCHGAGLAEQEKRVKGDLFNKFEGVSCENCHGPASGWYDHADSSFRSKTTAERASLGLNDLRQPKIQSAQCLSCHIGNSDEGKVVTHEMYAAGHPPLPSIEVATFSDVIPRHWFLVGEKKSEKLRKAVDFVEGTKEKTRLSLVGSAVALKTTMQLLASETKANGTSSVPGLAWPDYARFDCWSCHHDLKRESWRQVRGFKGSPGRPPINEWPMAIVDLGISRLEFDDPSAKALRGELLGHQKAVLDEANARPYGRKAGMATAASQFANWSDVLIDRLSKASYDESTSLKLLKKLVETTENQAPNYDEARQVAWTIKILVEDAEAKLPERAAIKVILKKMDKGFNLILPAGRDYKIEDQLDKALQIIGDYEPSQFQEDIKALKALLPNS